VIHPLLHLIATQPQLLANHAEAYADLLGDDLGSAVAQWKRRAALKALGLCMVGVSAVLGGVALMLWAVIPPEDIQAPWALVLAPGLTLAVAVACWLISRSSAGSGAFDGVRRQMKADVAMLREVSSP
jgi:hypothetical protein